jgi:flagellar hook-associated protein 1
MRVYDNAGNAVETVTVPVTAATTSLSSIAASINASANLSASITSDGLLQITPASGRSFVFSNDTSGALTTLGINGFFTGTDAGTIAVNQDLINDPRLVSSRSSLDPLETGQNDVALQMASLRNASVMSSSSQTFNGFYQSTVVDLGVQSRLNSDTYDAAQSFATEVDSRRQETSGVNLDEEVTLLLLYQRAFQASSRVITFADKMLDNLMNAF